MWLGCDGVEDLGVIWNYLGIPGNSRLDFSLTLTYSWFFLMYNFTFIFFNMLLYKLQDPLICSDVEIMLGRRQRMCFYTTYVKFIDFSYVNVLKFEFFLITAFYLHY